MVTLYGGWWFDVCTLQIHWKVLNLNKKIFFWKVMSEIKLLIENHPYMIQYIRSGYNSENIGKKI